MTNSLRSELTNLLMCILLVLALVFLFIFPRNYLNDLLDDINIYANNTKIGIEEDNGDKIIENTQKMVDRFQKSSNILKLFLNHEDVDELELYIQSCYYTAKTDQKEYPVIIDNLENILQKCKYLFDVETFTVYNLF